MQSKASPRIPQKYEVWRVKDLWADKAEFFKCSVAKKLPRHLDKHDGFACVPYKSRPVIVFKEDLGRGAYVCRCSSLNKDGTVRPNRVRLDKLLPDDEVQSSLFLEPPTQYPINYFDKYCGKASREVCLYVWGKMKWILLRGSHQSNYSTDSPDSAHADFAVEFANAALASECD